MPSLAEERKKRWFGRIWVSVSIAIGSMTPSEKGLVKKAKKLELEGIRKCEIASESLPELDELLDDAFVSQRPRPIDYAHRMELARIFNAMAKELFGKSNDSPVVEVFGSFIMDMFSSGSDLDLSVNFSSIGAEVPRQRKVQVLRKFAKKFYSLQRGGHVSGIQVITTARVPIVKVIDRGTGVECDLSVENRDGILKSQIIHIISMIDERFQKLSLLMKSWAKAHDINSSKDRTLNSLSIISLVAFHLQTRDPPILPPFSVLLKDGTSPAAVMKIVQNYKGYGKGNKESVGKLFVTLFAKMASVETMWHEGLCASLYEASWIIKSSASKFGSITVEDFTNRSQNFARAVGPQGFRKIYNLINVSLDALLGFLNGQSQKSTLKDTLFGMDGVTFEDKIVRSLSESASIPLIEQASVQKKLSESTSVISIEHGSHQMKKRRLTGLVDKQAAKGESETMTANKLAGKQMTKGREEVNHFIEHDSHQKKKRRLTSWEDKRAANGGDGVLAATRWNGKQITNGSEQTTYAEAWGLSGSQFVQGWRGTLPSEALRQKQPLNGWGDRQQPGNWRENHEANGWIGAQQANDWGRRTNAAVNSWGINWQQDNRGGTFQVDAPTGGSRVDGWGRAHQVDGWGRQQQHNDGWGVMRPNNGGISNPTAIPWLGGVNGSISSVPTYRSIGFEGSYSANLQPQLISPQNSLALDVSHSVNLNALLSYLGQVVPQHAQSSHSELFRR